MAGQLVAKTSVRTDPRYMYYLSGNAIMRWHRVTKRRSQVRRVRFKRESGYLYYVKDGNIYRTRVRGKPKGAVDRKPRKRRTTTKRKPRKRRTVKRRTSTGSGGGLFGGLL